MTRDAATRDAAARDDATRETATSDAVRPTGRRLWTAAARPRTLPLAAAPVVAAAALAWRETGTFQFGPAAAALLGALLLQIGVNYDNDAADGERGADGPGRLGPQRAVASGWTTAAAMKRAAFACFAAVAAIGVYLTAAGGPVIFVLGTASLLAGWAYAGGPRPIAYTPLGELFVFLFFGLAATGGTYWLQTAGVSPAAFTLGAALGCPAAAVLIVNNHRDRAADARAGRRTLALLIGPAKTIWVYAGLTAAAFPLLGATALLSGAGGVWAGWATVPMAAALIQRMRSEPPGPGLNGLLAQTAQFQAATALSVCAGLLF